MDSIGKGFLSHSIGRSKCFDTRQFLSGLLLKPSLANDPAVHRYWASRTHPNRRSRGNPCEGLWNSRTLRRILANELSVLPLSAKDYIGADVATLDWLLGRRFLSFDLCITQIVGHANGLCRFDGRWRSRLFVEGPNKCPRPNCNQSLCSHPRVDSH